MAAFTAIIAINGQLQLHTFSASRRHLRMGLSTVKSYALSTRLHCITVVRRHLFKKIPFSKETSFHMHIIIIYFLFKEKD